MYREKILRSFEKREKRAHGPRFGVRREKRGWRVFDGDTAIAFCYPTFFDIWAFSPFEPHEMANAEPAGKVVDLHTVHNTVVNLGVPGWPEHWRAEESSRGQRVKWKWLRKSGSTLEARISTSFARGERIQWVLRVRYDAAWARYRYTIDIDAWKTEPEGLEPLNMMMAGALQARAKKRRWTHSVWEDPDGRLRRVVHSNALFTATDYRSAGWRSRNTPSRGAWVAYASHGSFNPAMLIHETNVPIRLSTCSQLFDEHIIWNTAGQENLDEEGYFHFRMEAELVNLKPAMAKALLEKAADPVRPKRWRHEHIALPFHMDRANSFEKPVNPWRAEECPIVVVPKDPNGPVRWANDAAHTGRRSIRMEARGSSERQELFPIGAVCNVRPHRRHRLSGWIKTREVDRFARLELSSYEYAYVNLIDSVGSRSVSGTKDWTRVEIELDSGDEAYLMPRLVLYGPGVAWFDDLLLEEVS